MFYIPTKETEEHKLAINNIERYYLSSEIRQISRIDEKLFFIKKKGIHENMEFHCTSEIEEEVDLDLFAGAKKKIHTLHRWGAPIYFKPTIYEIFLQIKGREWAGTIGFKIEPNESSIDDWSDIEKQAMQSGFHIGRVTLFTKKDKK